MKHLVKKTSFVKNSLIYGSFYDKYLFSHMKNPAVTKCVHSQIGRRIKLQNKAKVTWKGNAEIPFSRNSILQIYYIPFQINTSALTSEIQQVRQ